MYALTYVCMYVLIVRVCELVYMNVFVCHVYHRAS
jgi:hypothetical protein